MAQCGGRKLLEAGGGSGGGSGSYLRGFQPHSVVTNRASSPPKQTRACVRTEAGWSRTPLSEGSRDAPGRPQQHSNQDMPVRWSTAATSLHGGCSEAGGGTAPAAFAVPTRCLTVQCLQQCWQLFVDGRRPQALSAAHHASAENGGGRKIARSETRQGRVPAGGQQPNRCSGSRKAERHGACGVGGITVRARLVGWLGGGAGKPRCW